MKQVASQILRPACNTIIHLVGPGGSAFDSKLVSSSVQAFRNAGANVFEIGDGTKAISSNYLAGALKDIQESSVGPVSIYVKAHGHQQHNDLEIVLDPDNKITSSKLFSSVPDIFEDRTTDFFLTCCHGAGAISHTNKLAKGSTVAAITLHDETASGSDVERFVTEIEKSSGKISDFSTTSLLDIYLGRALKNRFHPVVAVSGKGVYDLRSKFLDMIGTKFSDEEKDLIHQKLDKVIGANQIDLLMETISKSKDEWGIDASNYGSALIITFASGRNMAESAEKPTAIKMTNSNFTDRSGPFSNR
jgi:hypothetical protein